MMLTDAFEQAPHCAAGVRSITITDEFMYTRVYRARHSIFSLQAQYWFELKVTMILHKTGSLINYP